MIIHIGTITTMSKLNSTTLFSLWAFVSLAIVQGASAQSVSFQAEVPEAAHAAANKSLKTLRSLSAPDAAVTVDGVSPTGLDANAKLGAPLQDYVIGLTSLRDWSGKNPLTLLRSTGQFVYPIVVEGSTKTSVTIAKVKGDWTAAIFGSANEARARSRIQEMLNAKAPGGNANVIQVRIPALNVTFIGQENSGDVQFTPLYSRPNLGVEAGKTEAAESVLLRLRSAAKSVDPNLPQ